MTPSQWLKSPTQERTLLAIVEYLNNGLQREYLSTHPFQSLPTDSIANQPFRDFIIEPPVFSRRMSLFQKFTTASRSDLTLFAHRKLATLRDSNVYNQKVSYLIGDKDWPLDEFIPIAEQRAESVTPGNSEVTIDMRDPSFVLDMQIDTGTFEMGASAGKAKPLCIGQVLNIEPMLEDAATHRYRVNFTSVEDITNVRDNGDEVLFNKDVNDGTFTLTQAPSGRITCDVKGTKTTAYLRYPGEVIFYLLSTFANDTNIADLSSLPSYTLGIYRREPKDVREIIDEICTSIRAFHFFSRQGQFRAAPLPLFTNVPSDKLGLDDVLDDGVRKKKTIEPVSKVTVHYARNYTLQSNGLAGSLTTQERELFSSEYQTIDASNNLPDYPNAQPMPIKSCLVNQADAQAVANAYALDRSVERAVYEIDALGLPFTFELGQEVLLTYPDYGFENGKTGVIVAAEDYPTDGEVTIDLWR